MYFEELGPSAGLREKCFGWLDAAHPFATAEPTEALLDALWSHCRIAVWQTRGWHFCEFCRRGDRARFARRGRERLMLGSAEIRVFSPTGEVYAAPNLVYHYVSVHRYAPPAEVVEALRHGPAPPSPDYVARLDALGVDWRQAQPRRGGIFWLLDRWLG